MISNYNTFYINLNNLKSNASYVVNKYNNYKWYIGVIKANAYGCGYNNTIKFLEKSGINYYAVSSIEEAIEVRRYTKKGILVLTPVNIDNIKLCVEKNISIVVDELEYIKKIKINGLKIHIKINTGMNRFGTNDIDEIKKIIEYANNNGIVIEGIYTHIYHACKKNIVNNQIKIFNDIISEIDYKNIEMIHIMNSESLELYDKFLYTNGIRVGDLLYGLTYDENYKSVFKLTSKIIRIRTIHKGDNLGYDSGYTAKRDTLVGILPIGYSDGIVKRNKGRNVIINNKNYKIIGNVCMGHIFIEIDKSVKLYQEASIIDSSVDVMNIAEYLSTSASEVTCIINKNIVKKFI